MYFALKLNYAPLSTLFIHYPIVSNCHYFYYQTGSGDGKTMAQRRHYSGSCIPMRCFLHYGEWFATKVLLSF